MQLQQACCLAPAMYSLCSCAGCIMHRACRHNVKRLLTLLQMHGVLGQTYSPMLVQQGLQEANVDAQVGGRCPTQCSHQ